MKSPFLIISTLWFSVLWLVLASPLALAKEPPDTGSPSRSLSFGSKTFTESYVLGEILTQLTRKKGHQARHRKGLGGTLVVWEALKAGSIDAYPEYTGTIAEAILKDPQLVNPDDIRDRLAPLGIGMSDALGFNNTYAIITHRKTAEIYGWKNLSDLARWSQANPKAQISAGFNHEFINRKDGWRSLARHYGIELPPAQLKAMDHSLAYTALKSQAVDLKEAYSTDAKLNDPDFVVLHDDQAFFPEYRAVVLFRLDSPLVVQEIAESLEGTLNEKTMIALNARAEETKSYAAAATEHISGSSVEVKFPWQDLWLNIRDHLVLVLVSMTFAIALGIPAGVFVASGKPGSAALMSLISMAQTIPALAFLALLIPLPGLGLSTQTALVALVVYSLLPIVRNTAVGLATVTKEHLEICQVMQLRPTFRLIRISLPMASPVIFAGVKTALIINIGTATLAALIGAGGLGEPILSGINLNDVATLMRGALPAAALALVAGVVFLLAEKLLLPRGLRKKAEQSRFG